MAVAFSALPTIMWKAQTFKADPTSFFSQAGSLYMKRWNEVVRFCHRLNDVLPIIRSCWDENKFMSEVSGGAEGQRKDSYPFSPDRLTVVLRDHLFFAYLDMVLRLAGMLERLANWAESCLCHEDVQLQGQAFRRRRGASRFQQRRRRRHDCRVTANFYRLVDVCPMRGRRLPELVVDCVSSSIAELSITCPSSSCCRRITIAQPRAVADRCC